MAQLQKRSPPAYPGEDNSTSTTMNIGTRYDSLPQSIRQASTTNTNTNTTTNVPAVSGALGASRADTGFLQQAEQSLNNVESRREDPPTSALGNSRPQVRVSPPATQTDATQTQSPGTRQSVELRRLDGKPYPIGQGKAVIVAKDMHDGALPPVYKRQASDPINTTTITVPLVSTAPNTAPTTPTHDCTKCGKRRMSNGEVKHSCTTCGKRKTEIPIISFEAPRRPPLPPTASEPSKMAKQSLPSTQSAAGPSSPSSSREVRNCNKCGRHRRPATAGPSSRPSERPTTQPSAVVSSQPSASASAPAPAPAPAPVPSTSRKASLRARLSIKSRRSKGPTPDVVAPSGPTPRSDISPITNDNDDSPLVAKSPKSEFKFFRNSSILRSLSRRSKSRHSSAPLPSQQFTNGSEQTDEQNAGRLINMISNAIKDDGHQGANGHYSKVEGQEKQDRPGSPFSFDGATNEGNTFEMANMNDKVQPEEKSRYSFEEDSGERNFPAVVIEETAEGELDHSSRSANSETANVKQDFLSVPASQADRGNPGGLSRFKSLRGGITRFNSLSRPNGLNRSTSLRRLESLKSVHRSWYRNDMSFEGAACDDVFVY